MVYKIFFCSEFPDIPEKLQQRRRRRQRKAIAKCYAKIYSSRERAPRY